ncbi:MAG TPA: sialidase family protein [Candidatus Angelobacter sp.]|nr:sialidase family protein [Candidatus Angelobacter sp.]
MSLRTCALMLLLISRLSAQQQLSAPPQLHLADLMEKPGYFNEPSIAVNPEDPQELAVAWQVAASVAYSSDGGKTWITAAGTAPKDYRVSGDVSITYDASGHAILCYIAFDKLGTSQYWAHGATRNGVFVRRSLDGGKTWESDAIAVISHETTPGIPFEDKPYIVADTTTSPHKGNLYIGWTQFTLSASELLFSRSTDAGKTWSKPITLSSVPGLPRDDNGALEGFHGAVGPDGTLYTVWADREGIMMATSHDGGVTFTKDHRIIKTGPAYFTVEGVSRSDGFPQIGVNPANGKLYVAWSDFNNGDVDVFVSSSTDHGRSWSAPIRVNNDPVHNGTDQFFQWMAVDPISGAVNVIFYDRRGDNKATTVTLGRSTDDGKTFNNWTFDSQAFETSGDFVGDYLAIAAHGNKVFGAWARQVPGDPKIDRGKSKRSIVRVGVANFNP